MIKKYTNKDKFRKSSIIYVWNTVRLLVTKAESNKSVQEINDLSVKLVHYILPKYGVISYPNNHEKLTNKEIEKLILEANKKLTRDIIKKEIALYLLQQ